MVLRNFLDEKVFFLRVTVIFMYMKCSVRSFD